VQSADVDIQSVPRSVLDVLGESYYLQDSVKSALEGRRIIVPVVRQGQVFQTYHVNASNAGTRSLKINDTAFRALTISVTNITGLSNMLRPGDKVDVIVTSQFKEQAGQKELKVTATLLQGIEILAVDNVSDADAQVFEYGSVTLKLRQEDVNRVVFAQDAGGSIHLAKMDAGASPSASSYPVFADTEYSKISDEVQKLLQELIQRRMNRLPGK
jgi:Flp pilus assembly protein CpaB